MGKFLQGGGAGNSIVWVVNVDLFVVNVKDERGDAHRVPINYHGEESEAIRRCFMGDAGGIRHTRGSGNPGS